MASFSDIAAELGDVSALLQNPGISDATKQSLVPSLCVKVKAMNACDAAIAVQLCTAINTAPIDKVHKDRLQSAIDGRLSVGLSAPAKKATEQQLLTEITNYLTQNDWTAISEPGSTPTSIALTIAHRLSRLGVRSLHE